MYVDILQQKEILCLWEAPKPGSVRSLRPQWAVEGHQAVPVVECRCVAV